MKCPMCCGDGQVLGSLGSARWYRCRACGAYFKGRTRTPPENLPAHDYKKAKTPGKEPT